MTDTLVVPLRCLIVDDTPLDRLIMKQHIARCPDLELVAAVADGLQALAVLQGTQPPIDVVFLDLEMPHLNGLDFLHQLRYPNPAVVLVSSRDDLMGLVTDHHVVDFMVKPVRPARFLEVLPLIRARCGPGVVRPVAAA